MVDESSDCMHISDIEVMSCCKDQQKKFIEIMKVLKTPHFLNHFTTPFVIHKSSNMTSIGHASFWLIISVLLCIDYGSNIRCL